MIDLASYLGQMEGGAVQGLGFTLSEDVVMRGGRMVTTNLDTYLMPTIRDAPARMTVTACESLDPGDPYGPRGAGNSASPRSRPRSPTPWPMRRAAGRWSRPSSGGAAGRRPGGAPMIRFRLDGADVALDLPPDRSLLAALRDDLGRTATKVGCEIGRCGACTILLDARP